MSDALILIAMGVLILLLTVRSERPQRPIIGSKIRLSPESEAVIERGANK